MTSRDDTNNGNGWAILKFTGSGCLDPGRNRAAGWWYTYGEASDYLHKMKQGEWFGHNVKIVPLEES